MLLICTIAPEPDAHLRQYQAGQGGGAEEVQVHQLREFGIGGLLDGAEMTPAGVVDQYVDPAVLGQHFVDDAGIASESVVSSSTTHPVGQFFEGFGTADGGDHHGRRRRGRPRRWPGRNRRWRR